MIDISGSSATTLPLDNNAGASSTVLKPALGIATLPWHELQYVVSVASAFDAALSITGIILTKLDGDARGGAALSMREVTRRPIKFTGTGEKLDQFELFIPERLAGRILGMGDVVSLVEKAAEAVEAEDAARL